MKSMKEYSQVTMRLTDRSQLVDGRWYNQQIQYTQNDVSIIIISSRITVSKPLNKSCEEGIIRMLNRRIQFTR